METKTIPDIKVDSNLAVKFIVEKNMLFSINDITINSIGKKIIGNFIAMLLIPSILMVVYRKRLIEFKLNFTIV